MVEDAEGGINSSFAATAVRARSVRVVGPRCAGVHSAFVGYDADYGTAVAVMINTRNPESLGLMAIETLTAISQTG